MKPIAVLLLVLVAVGALIFGLLSGLGYAIYSVCSADATRRGYDPWTVVCYSLGIGTIVLFAITPPVETLRVFQTPGAWPALIGVALPGEPAHRVGVGMAANETPG